MRTIGRCVRLACIIMATVFVGGCNTKQTSGECCGPTCVYVLCQHFGIDASFGNVMHSFGNRYGYTSFADLQSVASTYGLRMDGCLLSIAKLRSIHAVGILHVNGNHFIDLLQCDARSAVIANPGSFGTFEIDRIPYTDLQAIWDGRVLLINQRNSIHFSGTRISKNVADTTVSDAAR
jgi:ABC-type bacteriocin/lantibiotic exporter with double-glycine peptidase domain